MTTTANTNEAPSKYELTLVRATGISVTQQRAMDLDTWLRNFGHITVKGI